MTRNLEAGSVPHNPFELHPPRDVQQDFIRFIKQRDAQSIVTSGLRRSVLEMLARDDIEKKSLHDFLERFPSAVEFPSTEHVHAIDLDSIQALHEDTLAQFERHPFLFNIYQIGQPHKKMQKLLRCTQSELLQTLERFPDPIALIEALRPLVSREGLTETEKEEIRSALNFFLPRAYGERYHAWIQLNLMRNEGVERFGPPPKKPETISPPSSIPQSSHSRIAPRTTDLLLKNIEIHGTPNRPISIEDIRKKGLAPSHIVKIDDVHIWTSDAYHIPHGRTAVVGYVESDKKLIARSFYLSNSHSIWKLLPAYLDTGSEIAWYDKGFGEESIALPFALQAHLAEIGQTFSKKLDEKEGEHIFTGIAKPLAGPSMATYRLEAKEHPIHLEGNFYHKNRRGKVHPGNVVFYDEAQAPDFNQLIQEWVLPKTFLYGDLKNQVFPSRDGRYRYLMCLDQRERAWVGGIETTGPVLSSGIRANWIDAGDLTTPAYDYTEESKGYGNISDMKDRYIDMFDRYVRHIPTVEEYLNRNR